MILCPIYKSTQGHNEKESFQITMKHTGIDLFCSFPGFVLKFVLTTSFPPVLNFHKDIAYLKKKEHSGTLS